MLHSLWMNVLYEPLYNALVFLTSHMPAADIGLGVIALTLVVKIITFPLTQKSLKSQIEMKAIEPQLEALKKEFPNKEEQAKKTFELYKTHKINPFSGCLVLIVQLPILIALYRVFWNGIGYDQTLLYPFVHYPEHIRTMFLGIIDVGSKNIILAILAGVAQFFQMKLAMPPYKAKEGDTSFKGQLMKNMNMQMKYLMPVFLAFIAYTTSGAIALYLIVNSVISIAQEVYIRRKMAQKQQVKSV